MSTASSAPDTSVDAIGDEAMGSPDGSAPRAPTTPSDTCVSYDSRVVMAGFSFGARAGSFDAPHSRSVSSNGAPLPRHLTALAW
jgi:hypothetical protein